MSTFAVALGEHFFWITSRAAGVAALLASSAAVTIGLLMGGRLLKGRLPDLRVTHEALSLATIAALLVHALALLGDGYLSPSLADVSIPLVSSYAALLDRPGHRRRLGADHPRRLVLRARPHRGRALAAAAPVHGAGLDPRRRRTGSAQGTDAGAAWFLLTAAAAVIPALALLAVAGSSRPTAAAARRRDPQRRAGRCR